MATTTTYDLYPVQQFTNFDAWFQAVPYDFIQKGLIKFGTDTNGKTIFEYANGPDHVQNALFVQLFGDPPITDKQWMEKTEGFKISDDGRSLVSTLPPGQWNIKGIGSDSKYVISGSGADETVTSYGASPSSTTGVFSSPIMGAGNVPADKQFDYLYQFTKFAQGVQQNVKSKTVTDTGMLGDISDFVKSLGPIAPIALSFVMPGVGTAIGSALGVSGAVGSAIGTSLLATALNGGDLSAGLKAGLASYAGARMGGIAGDMAKGGDFGSFLQSNPTVLSGVVNNVTQAAIKGQNVETALAGALLSAGVSAATSKIEDFNKLPDAVQSAIQGSISQSLQGKDVTASGILQNAAINGLTSYALNQNESYRNLDPRVQNLISTGISAGLQGKNLTQTAINWALSQSAKEVANALKFPDAKTYEQYSGDIAAYTAAENEKMAVDAGFPDYNTYQEYGGDSGLFFAKQAGFPDTSTFEKYDGNLLSYLTAKSDEDAVKVGFPDFATQQRYQGNIEQYNAEKRYADWWNSLSPQEQAFQNQLPREGGDFGFTDFELYKKYNGDYNAYVDAQNESAAKDAGFPDYATKQQYGGDINQYNAAKAGWDDYASQQAAARYDITDPKVWSNFVSGKTEEDKIVQMLQDRGITPTAERVADIMKAWDFDPKTPSVGFSDAFNKTDKLNISNTRADSAEEAASLAKSLGYSSFSFGGNDYKINLASKSDNPYDFFASFDEAFKAARSDLGAGKTFQWTNPQTGQTQEFTTSTDKEQAVADQKRVDMLPAYGGSRNTQTGKSVGAENLYIDKPTGQVVNDTRVWDAMGNVVSGELSTVNPNANGSAAEKVAANINEGLGKAVQAYLDVSSGVIKGGANLLSQIGTIGGMTGLVGMDNWMTEKASDINKSIDSIRSTDFKDNEKLLYDAINKAGDAGFVAQAIEAAKQFGANPLQTAEFIAKNGVTLLVGGGAMSVARALGAGMTVAEAAAIGANAVSQGADVAADAYKDALKNGKTEQEALDAARVSWAGAALTSAVANKLIPGALSNEAAIAAQGVAKNSLVNALKGELSSELAEEISGKVISNLASGNAWDKDLGSTAVQALIGSGAVTGLVQVAQTGSVDTALAMAKDAGVSQQQIDDIQSAFKGSIGTSNYSVQQARDQLQSVLSDSKLGADAVSQISNLVTTDALDSVVKSSLESAGVPVTHIDDITRQVTQQLLTAPDQQSAFAGISTVLQNNGLDPLTSNLVTNQTLTGTDVKTAITNDLKSQGYTPTQDELNLLVSQNANARPDAIAAAIASYTGPRVVTADEAKAALISSGLTNPSQTQIDALTGQYDQNLLESKASQGFQQFVTDTKNSLQSAVDAAKASGLTGDAAIQSAIDTVATNLGTSQADLLKQLGTTESGIRQDLQYNELTQGQKDLYNQMVAQGVSQTDALNTAMSGVQTQIQGLSDTQTQQYNQLTQGQKDLYNQMVAQGASQTDALNTAISGVQGQIQGLSDTQTQQYNTLTQGQKDLYNQMVAQGISQTDALNTAISGVQTQIQGLSDAQTQQYNQLTQGQKDLYNQMVAQGTSQTDALNTAISGVQQQITTSQQQTADAISRLDQSTQAKFEALNDAQKAQALQLANTTNDLKGSIDTVSNVVTGYQTQTQAEFERIRTEAAAAAAEQAARDKAAADAAAAQNAALQKQLEEQKAAQEAAATAQAVASAQQAATQQKAQQQTQAQSGLSALSSAAPTGGTSTATPTPLQAQFLTSKGGASKFINPLAGVAALSGLGLTGDNTGTQEQSMQTPHYSYGNIQSVDEILGMPDYLGSLDGEQQPQDQFAARGGLMSSPLMAATGGMAGTRYGQYAAGGLPGNVVHHSGKARVDFRRGDAVTGAGDGQSDDIPAMLADGEFVFPADVVAAIGNGSTKAGSDKLYDMMHGIRAHVRSAKPKDLPPEIKSPLDFLGKKHRKA